MSKNVECGGSWMMLQLLEELHKQIQKEMNAVQLTISRKHNLTSMIPRNNHSNNRNLFADPAPANAKNDCLATSGFQPGCTIC